MSRKEREREKHCREIGCFYYKRCSVKWGADCARDGGKKIPRFREKSGRRHRGFLVITGGPGEEVRVRLGGYLKECAMSFVSTWMN